MDLAELRALSTAKASDFEVECVLGSGQHGLVLAARCLRSGTPDHNKLYAVKLLYNFTHEYTSVVRNAYENEWLILSRLLPHENVIRFWAQFISPIPESFAQLLEPDIKKHCTRKNRSGQIVASRGQFIVLDYRPYDLDAWISKLPQPTPFEKLLHLTEQILEGVLYLEQNLILHLDLKLSNILIGEDEKLVLCDFGCAMQFSDKSFTLPFSRGMQLPGGNRLHLAPEILNSHHMFKRNPSQKGHIDYSKQASFAVGVLIFEIATGDHPLYEYPLSHTTKNETINYDMSDVAPLPKSYPKSFCSIVLDMVTADPGKRLSIEEALNQLRVCCIKRNGREGSLGSISAQVELERTRKERDMAKTKLHTIATERDFAVSQMKEMAEQVQSVAEESKYLADHCSLIMKELEKVHKERDSAVKACESAYEAGELLREKLALLTREKELAEVQVEEFRMITSKFQVEEKIEECGYCHTFYVELENKENSCHYHRGKYLHKRWSCCYKSDENGTGCKTGKHVPKS